MDANGVLVFKNSVCNLDVHCSVNFMLVLAN